MLLDRGDPGGVLGPALTHGVAALLHGPNGAPSLHSAPQSPALLQILKGQRPQVMHGVRARALGEIRRAAEAPVGQGGVGRVCRTLTLRPGERTGSKRWSRKPSRFLEVRDSPVGPGDSQRHQPGARGFLHPYFQHLSTSACLLPASPVWLPLGSGGAGPGGGPGGSEGAWTPGAGGISSALQETEAALSRYLGWGWGDGSPTTG